MTKRITISLLGVILFTGCSHKLNFKSSFEKNTSINKEYEITGKLETYSEQGIFLRTLQNRVVLYINNKLVVKSPLNEDYSGRTELYYDSKPLILECGKDNIFSKPKCVVHLDGQNLGMLTFDFDFSR